jgi:hypothetical protein
LRNCMIEANLESISSIIRYRDFDGNCFTTKFKIIKEMWDDGLKVTSQAG